MANLRLPAGDLILGVLHFVGGKFCHNHPCRTTGAASDQWGSTYLLFDPQDGIKGRLPGHICCHLRPARKDLEPGVGPKQWDPEMDSGPSAGPLLWTICLLPCFRCRCKEMKRTGNQGCICQIIPCQGQEDHGQQVKVGLYCTTSCFGTGLYRPSLMTS